jgi:FtsZ-binding cell division protein ZapB
MSIKNERLKRFQLQEAANYVYLAQKHVDDLQKIYDATNSNLSMAKMQLTEYERRLKEAEENYVKSLESLLGS